MQTIQSYPPPTELPAMRAGEQPDGRYLDWYAGIGADRRYVHRSSYSDHLPN